jgi:uncharacterized membrane protein YgcG
MFTDITGHSGALVTTVVVLTGAAILRGGAATADPNQDDQFLALLEEEDIPALSNVPSLIVKAHQDCRQLDRGMSVDALVDEMTNDAYGIDPSERQYPPDRLTRTMARFITAAVEAYCPYDKGKIASIVANPAMGSKLSLDRINGPAAWQQPKGTGTARLPHFVDGDVFVAGRYGYDRSHRDGPGPALASLIGAVPAGVTPPDPPQIPTPSPPAAQIRTAPRPIAPPLPPKRPPPPPQQLPPPPQEPPPPPQQVEPPAVGPQPGGAGGGNGGTGTGGGGGNGGGSTGGGGGPAEQSPAPPMPPGFVRLAP